jgi:hypothetical protein
MNYLKQARHGFTREKLLSSKWNSPDLLAVVAYQTLGGTHIKETPDGDIKYGGVALVAVVLMESGNCLKIIALIANLPPYFYFQ